MSLSGDALLVLLGLLPSLIWMFFFLKRDKHPEPKYLLTKTFLMGIILSPLAVLLQLAIIHLNIPQVASGTPGFYLWAALVEELIKYWAVSFIVLSSPEFDEPVDAMIYMMVAGLGFAAIENILVLFRTIPDGAHATMIVWTLRSIGATLLHALSSSLVGYFLAMSWFFREHHKKLLVVGLCLATLFHFVFNLFLSAVDDRIGGLLYAMGLLLIMSFLVSLLFVKIRERHTQRLKQIVVPAITNTPTSV